MPKHSKISAYDSRSQRTLTLLPTLGLQNMAKGFIHEEEEHMRMELKAEYSLKSQTHPLYYNIT